VSKVETRQAQTGTQPVKPVGNLGVPGIVFIVAAAAAPLSVIGSGVPLGLVLGNGVGFPAMYAMVTVVLLLFSVGLATMARHVPKPGAFFTFVGYGLGRPLGLASAFLALLSYTTVQIAGHAYLGYILSGTVARLGGPLIPWWVFSLVSVTAVAMLGYRNIDLSGKVLGVLLLAEVGIVLLIVAIVVITGGSTEGLSVAPFEWSNITSGEVGVGLTFAISAFLGFESTAIFRDEAKNPHRTIPRATYVAVISIGVFYTLASWAMVMAWGPSNVVAVAAQDPGSFLLTTTAKYLGAAGVAIVNVLLITSTFACVLAFHNVIARYQFSMARAGVLPTPLGRVHRSHGSPHTSSLVQTVCAAILILASMGLDPVLTLLTWGGGVATLAIVVLMTLTSIAALVYFARHRVDRNVWRTIVAPSLGLLGLLGATVLMVGYLPFQLGDLNSDGVPVFGTLTWIWIGVLLLFPALGLVQALIMRRTRPEQYAKILDTISDSSEATACTDEQPGMPLGNDAINA
jgi:amino acid transporter